MLAFATAGCGPLHRQSVDEWWQSVIEVDADDFTDIQHFTFQGIDYSHHFRFAFTDRSDVDAIIRRHVLKPDPTPSRLSSSSVPHWFHPTAQLDAFSNGDTDPSIVVWIDEDVSVAYFELVKF
ncbi:hypothetical protein FYK55_26860 [Roseiconus nitratireducens]|uniref:Uncharacterized protein n=1 Tax=Roseiconus nitratireducens TaxID=2605748 RepID=A0A5M6D0H6_9BACT|nr:hypothetical protein FYK55_26860 [Roseiconus nitratireducens]